MSEKAFYAKVTTRHDSLMPGTIVYMKVIQRKSGRYSPMLYAILDRRTGFATGDEVDANTFRNQFAVISSEEAQGASHG